MKLQLIGAAIAAFSLAGTGALAATTHAPSAAGGHAHSLATARTGQPAMLGPSKTGQPNQECGSATAPNTPGRAASAPGSAFNPGGRAGTVYAGEQPQNSRNTASVSQYDSACAHQSH
jgi:hypothetical protein